MKSLVIDASIAISWCFPDEATPLATHVLRNLVEMVPVVPEHFWLEVSNAALMAQRRNRIPGSDLPKFIAFLDELQIHTDMTTGVRALSSIHDLARAENLTVYDAAYLDLALREGLPLATLDEALIRAAASSGATIFSLSSS